MAKVICGAAFLGAALQSVISARVQRSHKHKGLSPEKMIADVPVHNYDLRFEAAVRASSGELGWILMLKSDEDISRRFCSEIECSFMGQGSVPFLTVRATEEKLQAVLANHPGEVSFVEPDLPIYEDPELPAGEVGAQSTQEPWGHATINLDKTRFTGKGVHIYVVDTGVRSTHQDFGGRMIPTIDTFFGDGQVHECDPNDVTCAADTRGHGTHCAGIAGGRVYGSAKEATLHAVKTCCGAGSNTLAGLDWLVQNRKTPAIATISLGSSSTSESSRRVVDAVVAAGITVFVSSGNTRIDACTKTYSFIGSVISIGAMTSTNARSSFSNWGECNALFAPGSSILSADNDADDEAVLKSGTSMAAPLAAGVGALILEERGPLTPLQVRQELVRRATRGVLTDLREGDPDLLLSAV